MYKEQNGNPSHVYALGLIHKHVMDYQHLFQLLL